MCKAILLGIIKQFEKTIKLHALMVLFATGCGWFFECFSGSVIPLFPSINHLVFNTLGILLLVICGVCGNKLNALRTREGFYFTGFYEMPGGIVYFKGDNIT